MVDPPPRIKKWSFFIVGASRKSSFLIVPNTNQIRADHCLKWEICNQIWKNLNKIQP